MAKDLLSSDGSESESGGVRFHNGTEFKVNEDFARKFTYNKKREELRQLEDRLSHKSLKRKRSDRNNETSATLGEDSTSESEDEDDAGELATEALDSEISATLNAIRSKDPKVYDKETTFYTQIDDGSSEQVNGTAAKKEKPMFLRDYHRQNLLNGARDDPEENLEIPITYNQEQDALKRSIIGEINAAAADDPASSSSSDDDEESQEDDGFLVAKRRTKVQRIEPQQIDVETAEKDPETFLSNFMAARAWIPSERSHFQPFESDDEEEERKADEFEEAYNLRFEDPAKSNEKLISHARDIAAKYSVRREGTNPRKSQREAERERKEAAKRERAEEKARLRKLKIEEAEEKLRKIKKAAGLRGRDVLPPEDWARFLDDDWSDAKWEEEMQKRFGEAYYAQNDASSGDDGLALGKKRRKPKKPKWDDDIEIKDLVPDFDDEIPTFELSDAEREAAAEISNDVNDQSSSKTKPKRNHQGKKKEARKERRIIEQLVEDRLELDTALTGNEKNAAGFHYRETSPLSFGLSSRDILMADDSQLNEYAGLKKLAAFRDPQKKRKDQKHLGKKARLRQWRRDTFGNEEGPTIPETVAPIASGGKASPGGGANDAVGGDVDIRTGRTKKRRRRTRESPAKQEVSA